MKSLNYAGKIKSYKVFYATGYDMSEIEDFEENVIYVLGDGSMVLNGSWVGMLDRNKGRIIEFFEDNIRNTWPEKKRKQAQKLRQEKEVDSGEFFTFDLDSFLVNVNKDLDAVLENVNKV